MRHYHIIVTGKVQGVFYRAKTREKALELNISGIVKNNADGSVSIDAEGTAEQLEEFIKWCRIGPSKAQVDSVEISEMQSTDMKGFKIIRFE